VNTELRVECDGDLPYDGLGSGVVAGDGTVCVAVKAVVAAAAE